MDLRLNYIDRLLLSARAQPTHAQKTPTPAPRPRVDTEAAALESTRGPSGAAALPTTGPSRPHAPAAAVAPATVSKRLDERAAVQSRGDDDDYDFTYDSDGEVDDGDDRERGGGGVPPLSLRGYTYGAIAETEVVPWTTRAFDPAGGPKWAPWPRPLVEKALPIVKMTVLLLIPEFNRDLTRSLWDGTSQPPPHITLFLRYFEGRHLDEEALRRVEAAIDAAASGTDDEVTVVFLPFDRGKKEDAGGQRMPNLDPRGPAVALRRAIGAIVGGWRGTDAHIGNAHISAGPPVTQPVADLAAAAAPDAARYSTPWARAAAARGDLGVELSMTNVVVKVTRAPLRANEALVEALRWRGIGQRKRDEGLVWAASNANVVFRRGWTGEGVDKVPLIGPSRAAAIREALEVLRPEGPDGVPGPGGLWPNLVKRIGGNGAQCADRACACLGGFQ